MAELLVPAAVLVVGPLVSAAIILIARLTHSGLHPTTAAEEADDAPPDAVAGTAAITAAHPRPAPAPLARPWTLAASLPRTEVSRG